MTIQVRSWIKQIINRGLARFGYQIQRSGSFFWDEDAKFNKVYREVVGHTVVSKTRCFILYQCAQQCSNLPGEVAEVGVYKGGTARLLAETFSSSGKTVYLFDTFSGMPQTDPDKDTHKEGDFNDVSLSEVKRYLCDCKNVRFYQGVFPATAESVENKTFSFVHIDADIYKSVSECCKFFYPRMEKCGIMIFDDYGFPSCPGAKIAVDEFFLDKPENPCYLPTGQCVVIKT